LAVSIIGLLSDKIYENPLFQNDYNQLVKNELSTNETTRLLPDQVKRLAESAAILSMSDNRLHQKLAFKIAIFLLNKYKNEYKILPYFTELILTRLGDLPTISFMTSAEKGELDYFSYFPTNPNSVNDEQIQNSLLTFPEVYAKKIFNQFEINEKTLTLTNFQAKVLRGLLDGESLSFSAPTSAGKSFIVHNYIITRILNSTNFTAIYLVPTKALITEVHKNIESLLNKYNINTEDVVIVNSAERLNTDQYQNITKKVLIVTQERLQYVLSHDVELLIDLLIIDEAQKLKEDERGVILEDVIDELTQKNQNLQVVFISPYSDPKKFSTLFSINKDIRSLPESKTPVAQNIFYVNLAKDQVSVSVLSEEFRRELIELEQIPVDTKLPTAKFRIKSWVVNALLKESGHTLIYCDIPTECINIANEISSERPSDITPELREAIDFVKTHVHEKYYLADHLQSKIGYHYGKMPQFVRYVVRDLFDNKHIQFLCCTSTLLEGVNLPAKNIVLHKPKSGMSSPMDRFSIKNLAGRAGRLGKDYYGNVYCIDINEWDVDSDIFTEELEPIESSIEKTLVTNVDDLIIHLQNYSPQAQGSKNIEAVATSLIVKFIRNPERDLVTELKKKYPSVDDSKLLTIKESLIKISKDISKLDKKIFFQNSSIDPRLQFNLYNYLKNPNNMVLPPEPFFDNFKEELEKIFHILQDFIFRDMRGESYKFFAFVANEWITQSSYKKIIEKRISFTMSQKEKIKNDNEQKYDKMFDDNGDLTKRAINDIIDDIDEAIESKIKYEFTRGLRCYCDVVKYILEKKHSISQFSMKLPDYLETGAYDEKVFMLLDLGLTRNSAIHISGKMGRDITTTSSVIRWLKKHLNDMRPPFLHPIAFKELSLVLESKMVE